MVLAKYFNSFDMKNIKGDLFGGLTAAVIALPLALAFGVTSGAGAIAGVYGAIIVGLFAAIFGGTATQISGPTGPMTIVLAGVISQMIVAHPENGIALSFLSVIVAGLFQIVFGVLKLGKYFVMVPYAVISGFMTGIGVIIILTQIAPLLGEKSFSNVMDAVMHLSTSLQHANGIASLIGMLTLLWVLFWPKRLARYVPASLVALIVLTLAVTFYASGAVPTIGEIPSGFATNIFPSLSWDNFTLATIKEILYFGFLLASLGAIDSLLTSMVADNLTQTHHHSDQELIGQGVANTIAGIFGALPGAGATMRTAINIRAGGKTALSGVVHSFTLLIIVLWGANYVQYIPHAVLAGLLIKVGLDIIDWRFMTRIKQLPLTSSCLMIVVLILTVFVDLITAVIVGMFIANILTLDRLGHVQLDNIRFKKASDCLAHANPILADVLVFEIDGPISFAVSRALGRRMNENRNYETLVIDLSKAQLIGTTTQLFIIELIERTYANNKKAFVVIDNDRIRQSLEKLSLTSLVPLTHQYSRLSVLLEQLNAQEVS